MFARLFEMFGWCAQVDDGLDFEVVEEFFSVELGGGVRACAAVEKAWTEELGRGVVVDGEGHIAEVQQLFELNAAVLSGHFWCVRSLSPTSRTELVTLMLLYDLFSQPPYMEGVDIPR